MRVPLHASQPTKGLMKDDPVQPLVSAGKPERMRIPLHRSERWMADRESPDQPHLPVFMTQTAYEAINQHANTDLDNEVGGWLAGRWCQDTKSSKDFVVVEALLPAQQVRSGSTFLTFTHDSQVAMLAALEERFANKGIVGWYHTHPRMGIFLSGYDLWLHDHFFPHPWQIALVVEPHGHSAGFFVRDKDNEMDGRRFYGFYELQNRKQECIANWKNLQLANKNGKKPSPKAKPSANSQADPSDTQPVEVKRIVAASSPDVNKKNNSNNGDAPSQEAAK